MSKILVSVNEENLKQRIKQKIRQEISNRINLWQHTNSSISSSGSLSPAQWWVDKPVNQGAEVRHELKTGINATMVDDTIKIHLTYQIIDISP